jgi:chromosome segregation ATPase
MDSSPTELDAVSRKIIQMEIEEAALKKEEDELSKARLAQLQKELAEERDSYNALKAQWENEKNAINRVQQLREQLEDLRRQIESAEQAYDLEKAARLQYGELPKVQEALQAEEARLLELMSKAESLNDLLTLDKHLTDVRTELEQVTSSLKVLENQVDYATIHLSISEVKEFTEVTEPETVWERISVGFVESLEGVGNFFVEFFVFIVIALPYLVTLGAVVIVVLLIARAVNRKKAKAPKEEKKS